MRLKATGLTLAAVMLTSLSSVYADDSENSCETVETEMVSLYYMDIKSKGENLGDYYEGKVNHINKMAETAGWSNYKMTSQDLSVNVSSYGTDVFDVNVSISIQMDADYSAVSLIAAQSGAYSMSASRYSEEVCEGDSFY